ncbi:MAG: hypothetical protein IJG84_20755 [Kiritimatiellae bacterium]|nr:hypothetical protein [Kiritimatiellia bacterium]
MLARLSKWRYAPVCRMWWDYMAPLVAVNPNNSPVSQDLKPVFHLD